MSGSKPTVGIRISADGADQARRQLEALGTSGEAALRRIGVASAASTPELQRLAAASDVAQRAFAGMGGSLGRIGASFSGVSGVASGLTAGFVALGAAAALGAVQIAKAGDTATATLARLSSATGGLAQAQQVYERLFALSQQTGIAVTESAGSFTRFAVAAKEIGGTTDQVLKLVTGIQKAGIVAGASAQETGAAVQQLGQALASGTLQGDELRSLLENMPQLAQALARELGVSLGQLRQMGSEGQLTAEKVFPALLRASEKMGEEFAKMPVTMSRAKDILIAATEDFGARLDRITGLSQTFARAMQTGAAALNAAGRAIAPNEREAADQAVADASRRVASLRSRADAARPDVDLYMRQGLSRAQALQLAMPALPGQAQGAGDDLARAESDLREALARQQDIRRQDRESQRAEAEDAARQAADARRTNSSIELRDVLEKNDKRLEIERKYREQVQKIQRGIDAGVREIPQGPGLPAVPFNADKALADAARERAEALKKVAEEESKAGTEAAKAADKRQDVIDKLNLQVKASEEALRATQTGTAASRDAALALEIESQIRAAGIPDIDKRTEAEKRAADAIAGSVRKLDDLATANKRAEEEAKKARDYTERSWNSVADIGERAMDRVADAGVQAMLSVENRVIRLGDVFRAVGVSAAADLAKLGFINPILNELFVGTNGPRATLSSALGGAGGIGSMLGLGSFMPSGGISDYLFGSATPLQGPGLSGSPIGSAEGLIGSGGNLFGIAGLNQLLGGAGLGAGIGGMTAGLMGGNSMYGSIGGAAGALLGQMLIPIPGVGAILGGLLGGAGGGLIGPGESVRGYGLRLQANSYNEAVGGTADFGTKLLPIDYSNYNETGAAAFRQAEQQVAATNAYLNTRNLRVAGASIIGGNKNGPDYSWADAGSVGEGFSRLRFAATDNANLDTQLRQRNFQGVEGLQAYVEGFIGVQDRIKALTTDAVPAFTLQLKAINDNFDALTKSAQDYGVAETGLAEARAKAIAALQAERAETLRQSDVSLSIRRLAAGGNTQEAELARQAESARQELAAFGKSLDALALTAEDKAARLVNLEEVQAAERAAIIQRYGEQAAQALRQAGSTIRQYLDGLATGTAAGASPTDRLAAAQAAFGRDLTLATGGDRDALGRITSSADTLLGAGRDVFASGAGFQAILQQVTGGLSGLPVVRSYDAEQAASLAAIQAALTTGTLNTATIILPAGNIVQLAGGAFSAASAADIAATAQATANTVGTLVSGLGAVVGTTATGLAAVNQSLGTIHASAVAGTDALAGRLDLVARATVAANDNILAASAAVQAGQVAANILAAGLTSQLAGTGVALFNGLVALNASLGVVHAGVVDVNASLATVHGSLVQGLGALGAGIAIAAQQAAATNASVLTVGAALQSGQAVANQIEVGNAAAFATYYGVMTTYLAIIAANTAPAALPAPGLTYGGGIRGGSSSVDGALSGYTAQVLNGATRPAQPDSLGVTAAPGVLGELQALRQEVATLRGTLQQVGVVVAQETRASGVLVAGAIEEQNAVIRRTAA